MASKSKRRRRVLGASCILAALIVAGSSFAWFASKDEVTNRLTASSDYGVSIVESFAPPTNWLPGQEVNKDVYAVNTGSIDAFVKESVTGVLNYTFERKVGTAPATTENTISTGYVELTKTAAEAIDGSTTYEGGSYLAYTNVAGVELGWVNSARTEDAIENTWHPTKTGVYIFRRNVTHNETNDDHPTDDKFQYAGYYYVANDDTANATPGDGKYYKIVIGTDDNVTTTTIDGNSYQVYDIYADENALNSSGTVVTDTDGKVTSGDPKIYYIKEKKVDDQVVSFTYEKKSDNYSATDPYSDTNHPARLVVEYSAAITDDAAYDASAAAARAQIEMVNAEGEMNRAEVNYNQAKADFDYAKTLATERDKLQSAANKMSIKWHAVNDATTGTQAEENAAWAALATASGSAQALLTWLNGETDTLAHSYTDDMNLVEVSPTNILGALENYDSTNNPYLSDVHSNVTRVKDLWTQIQADKTAIATALGNLASTSTTHYSSEEADAWRDEVVNKFENMKTLLDQYKQAYGQFYTSATTASLLALDTADPENVKNMIAAKKNAIDYSTVNTNTNTYITKHNANTDAQAALATETANWEQAKADYNENVGTAKSKYQTEVVSKVGHAPELQDNGATHADYVDNSVDIVSTYSANRETQSATANPALPNSADTFNKQTGTTYQMGNDFDYYKDLVAPANADAVKSIGSNANGPVIYAVPTDATFDTTTHANGTPADADKVSGLKDVYDTKKATYDDKKATWESAVATENAASKLKFYVNLAEDYDTNWKFDYDTSTAALANQTPITQADFYLKKILKSSETSEKLIDSVTFDKNVTADAYKNLTFDLNVGLDSAQVTYNDKYEITTDAVDGNQTAFVMKVNKETLANADETFDWVTRRP